MPAADPMSRDVRHDQADETDRAGRGHGARRGQRCGSDHDQLDTCGVDAQPTCVRLATREQVELGRHEGDAAGGDDQPDADHRGVVRLAILEDAERPAEHRLADAPVVDADGLQGDEDAAERRVQRDADQQEGRHADPPTGRRQHERQDHGPERADERGDGDQVGGERRRAAQDQVGSIAADDQDRTGHAQGRTAGGSDDAG